MTRRLAWPIVLLLGLMALPAASASPSARISLATNPVGTCPYWSELDTNGTLKGKTPQAITITKKQIGMVGSNAEWEVSGRSTKAGIALYSGMVQILANKPPFGWGLVRYVWLSGHGREMTARFTLEPGQIFRSVVCGRHPHVLPPNQPYTGRGSSCKKPLVSEAKQDLERSGDLRHMPVSIELSGPPANVTFGKPTQPRIPQLSPAPALYYLIGIRTVPKVVLCNAYIIWRNEATGEGGRYHLHGVPHGQISITVGDYAPWSFDVIVNGRYVKGRP